MNVRIVYDKLCMYRTIFDDVIPGSYNCIYYLIYVTFLILIYM